MTGKISQATIMVELAIESGAIFFHTPALREFAAIRENGHLETLPLKGMQARRWLASLYRRATGGAPGSQALADAITVLAGHAFHDGDRETVHVRVAGHEGDIYIDLGDPGWRAIKVSRQGWEIVDVPPVYFRRMRGALPLPAPLAGNVTTFWPFLNVIDEDDLRLLMTALASFLFPDGPFVIIILNGEQGSAKSFLARLLRDVIDPSAAPLRTLPRDERDLMISANNSWVQNFDNVSSIRGWLSDALCRLSTGAGFATRELFTDDEEAIFDAARPVILNGISNFVTRGDLADRSITFTLPAVPDTRRKTDDDILREFHKARPYILGGVLDLAVEALRNERQIKLDRLPRMATFARRGYAMAPAAGWSGADFMITYAAKIRSAGEELLAESPIAELIMALIEDLGSWEGTATELLSELTSRASETLQRSVFWPKAANVLSNDLKRIVPVLRAEGVEVEFGHRARGRRRYISIRRVTKETVIIVTPSTEAEFTNETASENDDDAMTMVTVAKEDRNRSSSTSTHESGHDYDDYDDYDLKPNSSNGHHDLHDDDARRQYLLTLGEEIGYPNIPGVIPSGVGMWTNVARYSTDDQISELLRKIEEHIKEGATA